MQTLAVASDLPERAARPRRVLLLPHRRRRGARRAARAARRDLARRARRSQHARDVAVRQRVGDAAADAHRPGHGRARRMSSSGARATSIRRRTSSSPRPASATIRTRCSSARMRSTSRSTATSSTRASSRSSCPSPAGRRSATSSSCWRAVRESGKLVGARLHGPRAAIPRTRKLERLARLSVTDGSQLDRRPGLSWRRGQ